MDVDDAESGTDPCCKIGRLVQEYDLGGFEQTLERRWTGREGDSASLRELQRAVNRRLLTKALTDAGVPPVDGEAENFRRILDGSEVSESRRVDARRRLESEGVDVGALVADFVSHQTVYNHLRSCRGVEAPDDRAGGDRVSQVKSRVFGLQRRTELVTEQGLTQLAANGSLSHGEFDVVVDVQAVCAECGRSHDIDSLLDRGGCGCE